MVIIITGASHTGKTLLAQRMLEKYDYPYLSIDHLKMGLIRSSNTLLTPSDDDKLTDYLWPIICEIIKTVIENNQNLIIEGCYIPSNWRLSFDNKYLDNIFFICLVLSNNYIDNNFDQIIKHSNDIEHRSNNDEYTKTSLKTDNNKYAKCFKNEELIIIDSNYEDAIKNVIDKDLS